MRVLTIPCRTDNFSYLAHPEASPLAVAVDPCEGDVVLREIRSNGLRLAAILNTHHHGDHVGGNRTLLDAFPGVPVYGHSSDKGRIPGQTQFLEHGDSVREAALSFQVLHVPGHTRGHIAYVGHGVAFVGDTLFSAGCGRLFEGTPEIMNRSLNAVLSALPDETLMYFAHEYTEKNLAFALSLEPSREELLQRAAEVRSLRASGAWTTPTYLGLEKRTNPFLRPAQLALAPEIEAVLGAGADPVTVFGHIRSLRNDF